VPPRPMTGPNRQRMLPTRYVIILAVVACLAGSGVGAALGEIHRNATAPKPPKQLQLRTYETRRIQAFHSTRRIVRSPTTLERLRVVGHGGVAEIEWYCGSMSSFAPRSTDAVTLNIDGAELAETVVGARGGEYDARAGILRWVGSLSVGPHIVSITLVRTHSPIALPLVVGPSPVQEGVNVAEHVR
jgi:hypothetical protein